MLDSYYESIFNELESQRQRFEQLGQFERQLLKFTSEGWDISREGILILPINHMNLNPYLISLHGGILIAESSTNNGLCIYGQTPLPIRVPQATSLQRALPHFITQNYEKQEIPVLKSDILNLNTRNEFKYTQLNSYNELLQHLTK